MKLSSQ